MEFDWDPQKATTNLNDHKVSFEEAASVFGDRLRLHPDPDHSAGEKRWLTFGFSSAGRLLVVSHTERNTTIHLISARLVSRRERKIYEEG